MSANSPKILRKISKMKKREIFGNGEKWPSGSRHCNQNWKVPGSNPTRRSARLRDPTSL